MKRLHPNAVWLFFFQYSIGLLFSIGIFGICFVPSFISSVFDIGPSSFNNSFLVLGIIGLGGFTLLVLGLCYLFAKLTYNNYFYELREDGFYKESGVITKKYVTIPYERIQNIDIYRGVLARIFGLSDLQIQTAGSSAYMGNRGAVYGMGAEGRLPGINPQDAVSIRDELVKRAKGSKSGL